MSAFQNYFVDTVKNRYAKFDGRASRSEYWYFTLFYLLVVIALVALSAVLGNVSSTLAMIFSGLIVLLTLGMIVPSIAVSIRRLHDSDKTGWFLLCSFIPFIGSIIMIVLMCLESTPGSNQYGPNPYDDTAISGGQTFSEVIDR